MAAPTTNGVTNHLDVLIVGAGIGGLTAAIGLALDGHNVTILEQAAEFGEVGAGMRIPPNAFKILNRWGVDLTYMKKTYSNGNRFLRYDDGKIIANMPHGIPEWDFGGSYLMVHRADYHSVLLEKAFSLGVDIRKKSKVDVYDWDKPAVKLESGEWVNGDLIIVADGVLSTARKQVLGHELPPIDTGDISYRILIPGSVMLADPELRDLVSQPWVSSWCGPDAHVIGYPVRGGEIYNVVCCCAARSMKDAPHTGNETKIVIQSNEELIRRFADWEPRVKKIVSLIGEDFLKWRLMDLDLVDRWYHPSGKAALLGDACHPMLPYMASGAAMATEDATVLRGILKHATRETIPKALEKYQKIRQPRASILQKAGRGLQYTYHLPDGEEQKARDEIMVKDVESNPIFWGFYERRKWLFGYDAEKLEDYVFV
ncbi:hypothetical protein B7463_g4229, partial [Scytalidium lignicola]